MIARLRAVFAFTGVVLKAIVRDRTSIFFMAVLPVVVIVIIGTTFGSQGHLAIGVIAPDGGPVAARALDALDSADGLDVHRYSDRAAMGRALRRYSIAAGVVLPTDLDTAAASGRPIDVELVGDATSADWFTVRLAVTGALSPLGVDLGAADVVSEVSGTSFDTALTAVSSDPASVTVEAVDVGAVSSARLNDFSRTAPQNLVLFVFINSLAGGAFLVRTRASGTLRRALSTRSGIGTQLVGLGLGWYCVALLQSALIIGVGRVFFDVHWGNTAAAMVLTLVFAAVGAGAGLLVGAIGDNEDRVGAMAPIVGLVLGALGGCMVPLEVFSTTMRNLAHVSPHYWAMRSWETLIFDGGGVGDITGSLAVLGALAVALVGSAMFIMRRRLVSA